MKIANFRNYIYFILVICLTACVSKHSEKNSNENTLVSKDVFVASVDISNPSEFARPDTLISFSLNELGVSSGPLQVWENDRGIATQLVDDDHDSLPDRLVFLSDLAAGASHKYVISRKLADIKLSSRADAEISVKDGGRWEGSKYIGGTFKNVDSINPPAQYTDHSEFIRYEGPGIESDHIAYRIYLDWRNGFDIFGKKTKQLTLKNIGQDGYDSYHEMADWGSDILKVGTSLGTGGFGFWDGGKVVLVSDTKQRSATINSQGPIYSSLDIDYQAWNTGADVVDLKASLSMQAGSPVVDVRLHTSETLSNIAIGLVAHPNTELLNGDLNITGEAWSYIASFGKQTVFDDNLGMFILFKKKDLIKQTQDDSSYVLVMRPRNKKLNYAFGALWAGQEGSIQTRDELEKFLMAEAERRTLSPRVSLKTSLSEGLKSKSPLEISTALADSEIQRRGNTLIFGNFDEVRERDTVWTYTTGLLMESIDNVGLEGGQKRFSDYAKITMDSYLDPQGQIYSFKPEKFNIDNINSGKMLQRLYARSGEAKYRVAIESLAQQLVDHPRTSEGAFWHKKIYPSQLWLDGVYMGMPFLAGVGLLQDDEHKVEEAAHEFSIARSHLRDPETGLYFHAWDEAKQQIWADKDTGRSGYVWGRGLGWFAMGLVDILDVIPEENSNLRAPLLAMVPELAEALLSTQDDTGVWYQVMDMPESAGNYLEASGSAMFTYFLAKAINKGYLASSYKPAAVKAYQGLVDEFISIHLDGSYHYTNICEVAGLGFGRDGSYRYYMSERVVENDPKGLAPAILAGVEVSKILN